MAEIAEKTVVVDFEIGSAGAWALAEFCKRVGWDELRGCAVDDEEAYEMRDAVGRLQKALADAGFAPR